MIVCSTLEEAISAHGETIVKDAEDSYRVYFQGEIERPPVDVSGIVESAPTL